MFRPNSIAGRPIVVSRLWRGGRGILAACFMGHRYPVDRPIDQHRVLRDNLPRVEASDTYPQEVVSGQFCHGEPSGS